MSAVEIRDAGWQAIMDDERLAGARRKLSFHEIRLIVDHARSTPPLDSEAVERVREALDSIKGGSIERAGFLYRSGGAELRLDDLRALLSLANPTDAATKDNGGEHGC